MNHGIICKLLFLNSQNNITKISITKYLNFNKTKNETHISFRKCVS